MSRPIEHCRYAMVHMRWSSLPDASLVAMTDGGHSATELAKAMARRAGPEQAYVVTDVQTGEQFAWTRERIDCHDAACSTGGEA